MVTLFKFDNKLHWRLHCVFFARVNSHSKETCNVRKIAPYKKSETLKMTGKLNIDLAYKKTPLVTLLIENSCPINQSNQNKEIARLFTYNSDVP